MVGLLNKLFARAATAVDRRWGWYRLPAPLALVTLIGYRAQLREHNLADYGDPRPPYGPFKNEYLTQRTIDGSYNNLGCPALGMAGSRFGRNIPTALVKVETKDDTLFEPNPFDISDRLLSRGSADDFQAAAGLNLLAAAWIQFEVHDWFTHGQDYNALIDVPDPSAKNPDTVVQVPSTPKGPPTPEGHTTFVNTQTHWWDGAQIYGATAEFNNRIRTGSMGGDKGKVRINQDGYIDPAPPSDQQKNMDGSSEVMFGGPGWWFGLELLATLFLREHNAICDRLAALHPDWSSDTLFAKARLINTALIAKIHTTEWTPAILDRAGFQYASDANWYGLLGKRGRTLFGRIGSTDLWSGVAGSEVQQFTAPYSITEEFVAVYRMHPLLPDRVTFCDLADNEVERAEFTAISGTATRETLKRIGPAQVLYSMGRAHPGAITLHNSPHFMKRFDVKGREVDLNALDILRCRERGIPRYNEFRKLLHLKPITEFGEISGGDPATEQTLIDLYGKENIDLVDTIVGMYGERRPEGFGFSDTAFRIFAVMAMRRLECDRFYANDFTPQVYTPEGMAWIEDNDMCSVLVRHFPELEPVLRRQQNAFRPWEKVTGHVGA